MHCVARFVVSSSAQTAPAPSPAPPAAEPDYPIIRVGVLSYVQYDAELKNRDAFNAFDLTRAYVNVNGQLVEEHSLPVYTGRATGNR